MTDAEHLPSDIISDLERSAAFYGVGLDRSPAPVPPESERMEVSTPTDTPDVSAPASVLVTILDALTVIGEAMHTLVTLTTTATDGMNDLDAAIDELTSDVAELNSTVCQIDSKLDNIETEVEVLQSDVSGLQDDVAAL